MMFSCEGKNMLEKKTEYCSFKRKVLFKTERRVHCVLYQRHINTHLRTQQTSTEERRNI